MVKSNALFGDNKQSTEIDLMVFGEIILKHWMYAQSRYKAGTGYLNFVPMVEQKFYAAPIIKFNDEYDDFKRLIKSDNNLHNDVLMITMAIVADLVTPELYFEKILSEFKKITKNLPTNEYLNINLSSNDYLGCILFGIRFFADQIDLMIPIENKGSK